MEEANVEFSGIISDYRKVIKKAAADLRDFQNKVMTMPMGFFPENADRNEIVANMVLTYRHLEDAAMRLGKVLQAHDGGVSVYDK